MSKVNAIRLLLLISFTGLSIPGFSQQWVTQKYDYETTEDVFFGTAIDFNGNVDSLKMDIYSPICDDPTHTSRRPLLICIYGGGFRVGHRKEPSTVENCKNFARRGYITAAIDYRLGYVFDDSLHQCNFPDYPCLFATDQDEWARAYYRGVQDAKGAIRYLINRNEEWRIDTNNVFLMGESAGAFVALGAGLLDTIAERPPATYALPDAPTPYSNMSGCIDQTYSGNPIPRPDLGSINGSIEPTAIDYTIKGIGNMYGGMFSNLLKYSTADTKPVIYSFHQPCDLLVPVDSADVYWGITWCMTHGYNCAPIINTTKVYGSRTMRDWNDSNGYGYTIGSHITSVEFPYNYWIGQGSCVDQVANGACHGYDNKNLRLNQMAELFATVVSTSPVCDTTLILSAGNRDFVHFNIFPNPTGGEVFVEGKYSGELYFNVFNSLGKALSRKKVNFINREGIDLSAFPPGMYLIQMSNDRGFSRSIRVFKE